MLNQKEKFYPPIRLHLHLVVHVKVQLMRREIGCKFHFLHIQTFLMQHFPTGSKEVISPIDKLSLFDPKVVQNPKLILVLWNIANTCTGVFPLVLGHVYHRLHRNKLSGLPSGNKSNERRNC